MKSLRWLLLVLLLPVAKNGLSQSSLPKCSSNDVVWTNCVGRRDGYDGEWRRDLYWGMGTLYLGPPSFAVYNGEFVDGRQQGKGTLYSESGEVVLSGQWNAGSFAGENGRGAVRQAEAKSSGAPTRATFGSITNISDPALIRRDDAATQPSNIKSRSSRSALEEAKLECRSLGFAEKTEKYGSCVLELSRRAEDVRAVNPDPVDDANHPDAAACQRYGYRRGSTGYADCRMQLDLAKRDYETRLLAYEDSLREYERFTAAEAARASRQRNQDSASDSFCIAACNVRRGSNPMACMSECGGASSGPVRSQAILPQPPPGRSTYIINGQTIYCSARPQGAAVSVTCN